MAQKLGVGGRWSELGHFVAVKCGQGGLVEKGRFELRLEGEKGMGQVIIWRKIK